SLASNSVYTVNNNIFLPNAKGNASVWATGFKYCCGQTGVQFRIDHNTIIADTVTAAIIDGHSNTPNPAGNLASYQNNIIWNPAAPGVNQVYKFQNIGAPGASTVNVCTICDYNDGWNELTDGGGLTGGANGYADYFSGTTPGTHDLSANPLFFDMTRNLATF